MTEEDEASQLVEPFKEFYDSALDIGSPDSTARDDYSSSVGAPSADIDAPVIRRMVKNAYDIFQGTSLDEHLRSRGITQLLVTGAVAHICISTSARSAFMRGFDVFIPVDGIVAPNRDAHLGTLKSLCHCCAAPLTLAGVDARLGTHGTERKAPSASPLSSTSPLPSPGASLHEDPGCGLPEVSGSLDCAVIGAGPAGITAAVQLAREGLNVGLFDMNPPGGLIRNAGKIENMPALADGIGGIECTSILYDRLVRWNIPFSRSLVREVNTDKGGGFVLSTVPVRSHEYLSPESLDRPRWQAREQEATLWKARSVILATGTRSRPLPPGWKSNALFTEYWPLRSLAGGRIAVIGGGDIAFDYALHSAGMNRVDLFYRGSSPGALHLLRKEVLRTETITEHACEAVRVAGPMVVKKNRSPGENELKIGPFDAILAAIGRVPERAPIRAEWRQALDEAPDPLHPDVHPGFFAAGDCIRGNRRQVAIAMGDGMRAAMMAAAFLT